MRKKTYMKNQKKKKRKSNWKIKGVSEDVHRISITEKIIKDNLKEKKSKSKHFWAEIKAKYMDWKGSPSYE